MIINEEWIISYADEGRYLCNQRRYLCNQAVNVTRDKCSYFWNKVTCKNCLKQKPK